MCSYMFSHGIAKHDGDFTRCALPDGHTVPHTTVRHLRLNVKPPIKWAGGKTWLVDHVAPGIADYLDAHGGTYYEPFLGAGAVALDLGRTDMILGDLCEPLINFYQWVKADAELVYSELAKLVTIYGCQEWGFKQLRERWNRDGFATSQRAAAFLYLNRLGYNGLWRVNRAGKYNVPRGRYTVSQDDPMPFFPSIEELQATARALAESDLRHGSYEETTADADHPDLVFFDPPYEAGFDDYTPGGFGAGAHQELAEHAAELADRGVAVLVTVSAISRPRYTDGPFTILDTIERRAVNSDGAGRKGVPCLLVVSRGHEDIVRRG